MHIVLLNSKQLFGKNQLLKICICIFSVILGFLLFLMLFSIFSVLCNSLNVLVKIPMHLLVSSLVNLCVLLETKAGKFHTISS